MVDDLATLTQRVDDIDEELGPQPQGVYASVRVRLDILESRIGTGGGGGGGSTTAKNLFDPVTFVDGNPDGYGVTIAVGLGVPSIPAVPGSLFLRTDGYVNQGLYVFRPDGYGWQLVSDNNFPATGQLDMNNFKIIHLSTPTNPTDAATKAYVDAAIPPTPTLSSVLAAGNTTGSSNIQLSTGTSIIGADGYITLDGYIKSNSLTNNSVLHYKNNKINSLPLTGNQFAVLMENPVGSLSFFQVTQDMVLAAFAISFSGGGLLEVSQTVNTPAFTASYNRTPLTAVLTDNQGNPSKNVISTPTSFNSNFNFTKNTFGATVIFTLTASDGIATKAANATYTWVQKNYHGVGPAGQNSAAFIQSLTAVLSGTRSLTFTDTASNVQKIYYATRSAYGTPTFTVGGFAGGFTLVSNTIVVTNSFGFAENYQLWESDNLGLGTTTVVVS